MHGIEIKWVSKSLTCDQKNTYTKQKIVHENLVPVHSTSKEPVN